jgi:hypothetical protein
MIAERPLCSAFTLAVSLMSTYETTYTCEKHRIRRICHSKLINKVMKRFCLRLDIRVKVHTVKTNACLSNINDLGSSKVHLEHACAAGHTKKCQEDVIPADLAKAFELEPHAS